MLKAEEINRAIFVYKEDKINCPITEKVTFYLEPDVSKQLGILAIENNTTKSKLANKALRCFIDESEIINRQ